MDHCALQRLLDEADCRALLRRYGQAVDWRDRAALETLFWPDAEVDLGFFKGNGSGAPDFLLENASRSVRRCHITTSSHIRVDGDVALADSCAVTQAVSPGSEQGVVSHLFFGRYIDRLERRGTEWRFASRRYLLHSAFTEAYVENPALASMTKADDLGPEHPLFRPI